MAPIWQNYFNGCEALVFVIDRSNIMQVRGLFLCS